MVTVALPTVRTQREDTAQLNASEGHYTTSHATKPSTSYNNSRENARTVGYFEPMTMILDHLAFSPKLSTRAVVGLGGHSQAYSDDLSL